MFQVLELLFETQNHLKEQSSNALAYYIMPQQAL